MDYKKYEERFQQKLEEYRAKYDVDSLENPNDVALLHQLIRNDMLIEQLQLQEIGSALGMETDSDRSVMELKKFGDLIKDRIRTNVELQKTLGIDRKSRRADDSTSPKEYIMFLKEEASHYLNRRLATLNCPDCNIQLAKYHISQTFSEFQLEVVCHQCGKTVKEHREELDRFHDIPDSGWRREYPGEVIQPTTVFTLDPLEMDVEDEIFIEAEEDDHGVTS